MSQKDQEKPEGPHPLKARDFTFTPLTVLARQVWLENKDKGYFTSPFPVRSPVKGRDKTRKWELYNEIGHTTEECRSLRGQIENLIRDDRLTHYVERQPPIAKPGLSDGANALKPNAAPTRNIYGKCMGTYKYDINHE
ncbi:hypothetical protein QJS10_CPA09g00780 [Acorus calamus]|uniref:Uncharacterized protein n=1 Tax=Acorus calamus TaxID=4465 RepID=A0AAV9E753_ACOCL|nr:hypothetical protein QJS10_CPA09g00780 [Acorus calamus]